MTCKNGEHPRGSIMPMDDDDGIFGAVCVNCGQNFDKDGKPVEDCVVAAGKA